MSDIVPASTKTIQEWMRKELTVKDDEEKSRFLVRIGRLTFVVGYDQLSDETERLLTIDHSKKDPVLYFEVPRYDKAKEDADVIQKMEDDISDPLVVRRHGIL